MYCLHLHDIRVSDLSALNVLFPLRAYKVSHSRVSHYCALKQAIRSPETLVTIYQKADNIFHRPRL
jgi:hypothetical protein